MWERGNTAAAKKMASAAKAAERDFIERALFDFVERGFKAHRYPEGTIPGLLLLIKPSSKAQADGSIKPTASWMLRTIVGTKRVDIGLGGHPETTMAAAQARARAALDDIANGKDPMAERKAKKEHIEWTFRRCADTYIETNRSGWKNAKHAQQWVNTLETYVHPKIGSKHVRDVNIGDVMAIVEPRWSTTNETMNRIRNRIELVLGWAAVQGHRPRDNPAAWRNNLQHALPKPSKVNGRTHHRSLKFEQLPDFMNRLVQVKGMSAAALQWAIFTACRSGEATGATWDELDLTAALWTVPKERMKSGREQRVPLSPQAMALLETLPRFEPREGEPDYIFPGRTGGALSDMAMNAMLRRMKVDAVPHGFRSSFTDWAAERTSYSTDVREMALAHTLGNRTREAYQRTDLLELRRGLMDAWGNYCTSLIQKTEG